MRLLHTADWHLGRLFHGVHLTSDQGHVLRQFVAVAKEVRPDAVVIAGDVYDRAVPPPEAVELLSETLAELALDVKAPIVVIAGNHDSPKRLNFCSRLLAHNGLHIAGLLNAEFTTVRIEDRHGPVRIYALPYAEPPFVRETFAAPDVGDHDGAMRALTAAVRARHAEGGRSVLVGHAFVSGGEGNESERPLSVGGAGTVDCACFDGFHYVALGHLHRRQAVHESGRVHYSGSLLKYSFSEACHEKSIDLIEMDGDGTCRLEPIRLSPLRDVRCVRGFLRDLLESAPTDGSADDYLQVTLLDDGALLDAMGKLREVYPNVLHIERPVLEAAGDLVNGSGDRRRIKLEDLFSSFFAEMVGGELSSEQAAAFARVAEGIRRQEREACA